MSGVAGLVDTLLAEKLTQRLDLVALRSAAVVTGPGPAGRVPQVANDVRLQSDAQLQRQVPGPQPAPAGPAAPQAEPDPLLSPAARMISAVLAEVGAPGARVTGVAPLLPAGPMPARQQVAAALAEAVALSGLFYESHLQEVAQGMRAPQLLLREPQAGWVAPVTPGPAGAAGAGEVALAQQPHAAGAQALQTVQQQLELVATGVFRWSGEAWPGVPMEWLLRQEEDGQEDSAEEGEPAPRTPRWTTAVALFMPNLGALEVRLRVDGEAVPRLQARVRADGVPLTRLQAGAADLRQRLEAAGFDVQLSFVDAQEVEP